MKYWKRIGIVLFCTFIIIAGLPAESFIAFAAETNQKIYKVDNGYIEYSIDTSNGAFSIRTKTGHPQKSKDDNMVLLYEGSGTETSYTTIRINEEDYIFGQDYSYFGIQSSLDEPVINTDENSISTTYHIKGIAVTQKVMISDDPDNALCGNAGVGYTIENKGSEKASVGIRTLLDTALGENDAPFMVKDMQQTPTKTEAEWSGDAMPSQIRGLNNNNNATQMSYLFLDGWSSSGKAKPDKVIVGHWSNMANTRYTYTPDKNCDFTNNSNKYRTSDSAVSLYWSQEELAPGANRSGEFLYGIGNFTNSLSDQPVNINMTIQKVEMNTDGSAYENDGVFELTVEIDNTVDKASTLLSPIVKLSMEEGITIVEGNETQTLEDIGKGQTKLLRWKLKAAAQKKITAKELSILLTTGEQSVNASRYVILPSVAKNKPNVAITKVSPETYYHQGEKNITMSGELAELMDPLKRKSGWDIKLTHKTTKEDIIVDKQKTAFIAKDKTLSLTVEEDMRVGEWNISFVFTDQDLVTAFGKQLNVQQTIEVSNDETLLNKSYAILAVERYNTDQYQWLRFETEEKLKEYREKNGLNKKDTPTQEILMEIRGKVQEFKTPQGDIYYAADPQVGNGVILNNTTQYSNGDPLMITKNNDGIRIFGKGRLSVVNNMTFWSSSFEITFKNGTLKTLNEEKVTGESERVRIDYLGIGKVIQNLAGFAIDLKYGEFIELWEDDQKKGNALDFGGKISLSFVKSQKKTDTTGTSPTPPSPPAGGGDGDEGDDDGEYLLSADVESVLFGQKKDSVGFLGINTTIGVGLPQNALGGFIDNPPLEASLTINTLDDIYELSLGVDVFVVSCSGTLRVKVEEIKGVKIPLPDKFELSAEGESAAGIPIVPPVLSLTGLKGGYDNLASTIAGKFTNGLPDLTLMLGAKINLVGALDGEVAMELGLQGLKLDGKLSISAIDGIELAGGMEANWVDPFRISAYGELSIFDVITGGVSMSIMKDSFYGYGHLTLKIPSYVPIVGNMKLAEVEGAISTQFVGMNVSVLCIKMGVAYYWKSNDVKFGDDIDLSESAMQKGRSAFYNTEGIYQGEKDSSQAYTAAYGTNFRKLNVQSLSASELRKKTRSARDFTEVSSSAFRLDPKGQDALLLEIPYDGKDIPDHKTLKFTIDDNVMPLTLDTSGSDAENPKQGSYLLQTREDKKYIYLTVTDPQYLTEGEKIFKLASSSKNIELGKIGVQSVLDIPELGEVAMGEISDDKKAEVTWTLLDEGEKSRDAKVNLYITDDKAVAERFQKQEMSMEDELGIAIGTYPANDKHAEVTLPETLSSGDYYVIATMLVTDAGTNIKTSAAPRTFKNSTLPSPIKNASLINAGDGRFRLQVEDPEDIDYTDYAIRILDDKGQEVKNGIANYAIGEDLILGGAGKCQLLPGVAYKAEITSVRDIKDIGKAYSDTVFTTEPVVMQQSNNPKLINMTSNIPGKGEITAAKSMEVTYTFDQPVKLQVLANQVAVSDHTDYKKEWTFHQELEDGEQLFTITAVNEQGDSYQEKNEEASLGFTIDTTAPQLMISQETVNSTQDTQMAISGQTVYVTQNAFKINGISEPEVTLQLKGCKSDVEIDQDGKFTISGSMDMTNLLNVTHTLEAVDKAGNKSEVSVYFVNNDITKFDSLKIMVKDEKGLHEPDAGDQGFGEIHAETGASVQLIPVAYYTDQKGRKQSFTLSASDVEWNVTGTSDSADFNQGTYQAKMEGMLCIGASLSSGTFQKEDGEVYAVIEDMVQIFATGEEIASTNIPEIRLQGDQETISQSQLVSITPLLPAGDEIKKVEVSKDNGKFLDITASYKNGYLVEANGRYVFKATTKAGIVSDITSDDAAINFVNIDTNKPELEMNAHGYESGAWSKEDVLLQLANKNGDNLGETSFYYTTKQHPSTTDWIAINGNELALTADVNTNYICKAVSQSGVESAYESLTIQIDKTAPSGEIQVVKNVFKDFIRNITSNFFFDKPVSVTIDAEDEGSGVETIEYYVSDHVLSDEALAQADFTAYKKLQLGIDEHVIVYARLTDVLGNTSIINTEGLIIDGREPKLGVIPEFDMENHFSSKETKIEVSVSDDLAGVNTAVYTTDEAQPQAGVIELDENGKGTITMKNNGAYNLTVTAYDNTLKGTDEGYNSGNPIVKKVPVKIDAVQPDFKLELKDYDADTWCTGPVNVAIQMNTIHASGKTLEIFKNGASIGVYQDELYAIKENGTYQFKVTTGSGLSATKEIVIKNIDDTSPNTPVIEKAGQYEDIWLSDAITLSVSFNKTEGCEEWLEASVDGVNYTKMDTGEYLADLVGTNRYYFRTVDELGRTSEVRAIVINIGNEPETSVTTGDNSMQKTISYTIISAASLFLIFAFMRRKKQQNNLYNS